MVKVIIEAVVSLALLLCLALVLSWMFEPLADVTYDIEFRSDNHQFLTTERARTLPVVKGIILEYVDINGRQRSKLLGTHSIVTVSHDCNVVFEYAPAQVDWVPNQK